MSEWERRLYRTIPWYTDTSFPPRLPQIFICLSSTQLPKTKLLLRRKNSEGHLPPLPSLTKVTPMAVLLGISDVSNGHGSFIVHENLNF